VPRDYQSVHQNYLSVPRGYLSFRQSTPTLQGFSCFSYSMQMSVCVCVCVCVCVRVFCEAGGIRILGLQCIWRGRESPWQHPHLLDGPRWIGSTDTATESGSGGLYTKPRYLITDTHSETYTHTPDT